MNNVTETDALLHAAEHEERQLMTVDQQIHEYDQGIDEAERRIEALQDAIKQERKNIRAYKANRSLLRQKRRIFEHAAFNLRRVDAR